VAVAPSPRTDAPGQGLVEIGVARSVEAADVLGVVDGAFAVALIFGDELLDAVRVGDGVGLPGDEAVDADAQPREDILVADHGLFIREGGFLGHDEQGAVADGTVNGCFAGPPHSFAGEVVRNGCGSIRIRHRVFQQHRAFDDVQAQFQPVAVLVLVPVRETVGRVHRSDGGELPVGCRLRDRHSAGGNRQQRCQHCSCRQTYSQAPDSEAPHAEPRMIPGAAEASIVFSHLKLSPRLNGSG
jgi:hypothetical protein